MIFSPKIRLLIAIFLPLTLGWKLTVNAVSNDHLLADVVTFLTRQGFQAVAAEDTNFRQILAVSNRCRMQVRITSNDGADSDLVRSLVGADENLIFVHQGKIYHEMPVWLAASTDLWARPLRKIGFTTRREFVLAVVTQRQCDAGLLPWDQLQ